MTFFPDTIPTPKASGPMSMNDGTEFFFYQWTDLRLKELHDLEQFITDHKGKSIPWQHPGLSIQHTIKFSDLKVDEFPIQVRLGDWEITKDAAVAAFIVMEGTQEDAINRQ